MRLVLPRALRSPRRLVAMAAVGAVAAASGGWALTRSDASAADTSTIVTATVSTVEQTLSASGTLRPARQAELSFSVAGTVASVPATVGQQVTAGQVLATVGNEALQRDVTTASASVDAAQEALDAQQDGGASDLQLAAAQAQVTAAQADLEDAQEALAEAELTSTIDGTVAVVGIAVGDRVGSGSASAPDGTDGNSSGSITVISTDAFVVDAAVGSADLPSVKTGLQARITPTGAPELVFGTVSSVGIVASSSNEGSASFPVEIAVTGSPGGLYAGGTVSVEIVVAQVPDVLTVPSQALTTADDGSTVVRKMVDGRPVETTVTVGTSYGPTTQIVDGLQEGDEVLVTTARRGPLQGGPQGGGPQGGGPADSSSPGDVPQGAVPGGGFVEVPVG